MDMTRHEVIDHLTQRLAGLGYRLTSEEPGVWFWEVGDEEFTSDTVALPFDSEAEAALAALEDLAQRTRELLEAARHVVDRWPHRDLAEAVNELDRSAQAFAKNLPDG